MARITNIRKQRGFSMVEALFSALILAIALLALAGFQAVALQDSSLVKARSVAANLAQEKLDDLKSFTRLTDGNFSDDGSAASATNLCGLGTFCFSEIGANTGGQEDTSGTLVLPSGAISGYVDNYSLSWTVACYAESAGAQLGIVNCADPDGDPSTDDIPNAKLATVQIAWTDSKGTAQSVFLQGIIYAMDPSRTARAAVSPVSTQKPTVSYTPIGVPDAVPVPINTGDGKFKESSKPLPEVISKGNSLRTEFDAVSYTTAGGSTKKDSQLEFATVNCVCEFAGSGQGYPASYFYWDGGSLKIKVPTAKVTKMTGTAPSIQGDKQDPLCTACCRDHHDSEVPGTSNPATALYDPDRPDGTNGQANDYIGNNHKHYYYKDANNPYKGLQEQPETTGLRYLEACRFARVDGVYRLLQDWRAIDLVVMPKVNYLNVAATLTAYQNYLLNYLKYQAWRDCTAASATGCATIGQTSAPAKSSLVTRDLLNHAVDTSDNDQLLARALYTDRVYSGIAPRTLDAAYYTYLANKTATGTWLDILPFNEVNVTLLASWSSDDTDSVTVTNRPISSLSSNQSDYYGSTLRGKTKVGSTGDGSAHISAYLLPSNSGLTGGATRPTYTNTVDYDIATLEETGSAIPYSSEIGTDRHDHASTGRKSDSILISRSGVAPSVSSGTLLGGNSAVDLAGITVREQPSGTACTVETTSVVGSTASGTFKCSTSYTGNVVVSLAGHFFNNALDANGNSKYDDGGTYTDTNTCTAGSCGNFWVFGPTINIYGTCNDNACADANVSVTSHLNGGTIGEACTIAGSTIACPVTLDPTSKTWTGTFKIANKSGAYYLKADATSCDSSDGTSAKMTTSAPMVAAGPADKQSAFNVCASDRAETPLPPSRPTVVSLSLVDASTNVDPAKFKLIWADVADETGYVVYKCTVTKSNSTCAPNQPATGTLAANTTTTTQSVASQDTLCLNVVATNAGGSSMPSQTMCVYHKKNQSPVISGPM